MSASSDTAIDPAGAHASGRIDVAAVIDAGGVSRLQFVTFVLCGLCLILDGFDVQAMGYVAPAIVKEWSVPKAALGPVFGAGLAGLLVGALTLSLLADWIGRRPVIIAATLAFAVGMLATTQAHTVQGLIVLRFLTGIGLGAIMPNALALASEYAAQRIRVRMLMLISCGFTVGAVIGGFVSIALIASYGWRSVFWVGGVAPLVLALGMIFTLPESIQLLVLRKRDTGAVRGWMRRIAPDAVRDPAAVLYVAEPAQGRGRVLELFRRDRALVTILLWAITFMNLINLYFLANWLPTVVSGLGYGQSAALLAGTMLQVGGTVGTLAMSRVVERWGFSRVLVLAFIVAAATIAAIGAPRLPAAPLFAAITIAGFCIVGAQPAVNALAAGFYPTTLRSTGLGWSLGVGRLGSITGPVVAGLLIGLRWSNTALFVTAAVPAALAAAMMIALGLRLRTLEAKAQDLARSVGHG